ncbi:MAG: hypothetical protein H0X25_02265 [Acidobacteriales bacterium]|nr:hypothetical protein [Terriglobales bacterium]
MSREQCLPVLLLILLLLPGMALAQGTYTNIDVPGSTFTYANGINTSGEVVGNYSDATGDHGFILSGGVYTTLGYPGAQVTNALGINDKGQVVGGTLLSSESPGFLYDRNTGIFTPVTYSAPGVISSSVLAINNSGTLVGDAYPVDSFEQDASGRQRVIRINGTISVYAGGISDSGTVFAFYFDKNNFLRDIRWRDGKARALNIPEFDAGQIYGTNPAGTAVAGFVPSYFAFVYQEGATQILNYPGAYSTGAYGVNAAGQVVGTYYNTTGGPHGFLWTPPSP